MTSTDLRKHITATYINLRVGLAILAIILPFVLWIFGSLIHGRPLEASMSAYYYANGGVMRDVFVGVLVAVGTFLYLYKGFTGLENIALNFAGIFLVGVALFPTEWMCGDSCSKFSLHGTFAVLFFLCIAYVCIFRASDTLHLIQDQDKARRYRKVYKGLGLGMILSPAIAVILTWILQPGSEFSSLVFIAEAVGVIVFGFYWITKSREIAETNSEQRAIAGELSTRQQKVTDFFNEISVEPANIQEP